MKTISLTAWMMSAQYAWQGDVVIGPVGTRVISPGMAHDGVDRKKKP
jgi:hypothetical protein